MRRSAPAVLLSYLLLGASIGVLSVDMAPRLSRLAGRRDYRTSAYRMVDQVGMNTHTFLCLSSHSRN
ncbi:hypothetical protein KC338_g267 [Hortaea werneckii]|nr:hypothetical protein KC338_g267 [Hortaea werneckii]